MRKLLPSGPRAKSWPALRRHGAWVATWLQDRRRGRLLPAPVLVPLYPSAIAWSWDYPNPAGWDVWQQHAGGNWVLEETMLPGDWREYATADGALPTRIVGMNLNGTPRTQTSATVIPNDAGPTLLTDLAAYWKLEEADEVGFMPRLDEVGDAILYPQLQAIPSVPGILGNAVDCYPAGSGLGGDCGNISLAGDFTVSVWYYLSEHWTWQVAFNLWDDLANTECFTMTMFGPFDPDGGSPYVTLAGPGGGGGFMGTTYYPGMWIHTVVAVTGNTMSVYADGWLVDVVALGSGARPTPTSAYLGGNPAGYGWSGPIDEVGFWNRALSAAEVEQLYNEGNGLGYDWF